MLLSIYIIKYLADIIIFEILEGQIVLIINLLFLFYFFKFIKSYFDQ